MHLLMKKDFRKYSRFKMLFTSLQLRILHSRIDWMDDVWCTIMDAPLAV